MENALWLIAGLVVLIAGGEFLVSAAVDVAKKFKVSTLVIGMTVVSFGTSAPELLVSLKAALADPPHHQISIGNIIGSNISNIALVLGLTVLIFPLVVDRNSIRIDWPMMMLASVLFFVFILDQQLVFWEGAVLFALVVAFVIFLIKKSRKEHQEEEEDEKERPFYMSMAYLVAGLVGLYFGAEWLVKGAVGIARSLEIEEHVIAVTVVAFGTSVPELVTSGVAAYRKQTDISVGNLIGSNIFNIMVVLGVTSMVEDINVTANVLTTDIYWMLGISFLVLPLMLYKRRIGRIQGAILLASYVAYVYIIWPS